MFGSRDLTSADQAATSSIKRATAAAKQAEAARTRRVTAEKAKSR